MFADRPHPAVLAAFVLAVLALGASALAQTTIDFWSPFTGPDGVVIEDMVETFNATAGEEAGVQVDLLIVPWEEYYTKLTVALASRRAPNLAIAHSHRIAGFVEQGALAPFDAAALQAAGVSADDYISALWNAGSIDGQQYAVPIDAFPRHLYYNKALFEQAGLEPDAPPRTLEELTDAAQKISATGDDVHGVFFRLGGSWVARDFYAVYWQFADDLLNDDASAVSAEFEDAATRTLEIMTGFIGNGVAPSEDIAEYESPFLQNRIGVAFSQITELPLFRDAADLEYGVAPFPLLGERPATFALGHNFIVPGGQSDDELAAGLTFIEWFSQNSLEWARGGKVPASFAVLESPGFAELHDQSVVAAQLDHMRLPPTIAQQPNVDRIVQETLEEVYAGRLAVPDAVARMQQQIDEALAD